MRQRILITGIAGFLGSNLCKRLVEEGHDVYGVDDLSAGDVDFIPPSFFHDLGERWGLRRVRGVNPSIKQLSRRDQIFDDLKAKMYLFQQRGSEVVSLLVRDPKGNRRSPRDLLLADRKELERELEKRVNQVLPRAEAKLLEGHHNEILTGPGPMREIAAIIRGDS